MVAYKNFNECILHCSKENLDFFDIRFEFYKALEVYIDNELGEGKEFCWFFKVSFPDSDIQSEVNYLNLLRKAKKIHFDNCSFYTSYYELDSIEVFFQDCHFHQRWSLYNYDLLENIDGVIYQSCTFYENVESHHSEKEWVYTYNYSQFDYTCEFKSDVLLSRSSFEVPPFHENQGNYHDDMFKMLSFDVCEFNIFELYLSNMKKGEVSFNKCHFKQKFKIRSIEDGDYEYQQENKSKLKHLSIVDCTVDDDSYLRIGFLDIGEFFLSNLRNPQNSELNIGDARFDSFKLRNFRNIGKFKLYKINILDNENGSLFQIDNTSIGNTDLQTISLTSFMKVKLFDNIFTDVTYTNMQWKEEIGVGEFNGNDITKIAKKRDTYRVLKNVAHKNEDQPQALVFYAKEMQHHKDLTIRNRCSRKDFKRYFMNDVFCKNESEWLKNGRLTDIITLIFNEKTNNFGLNWWQPIYLLLIISLVFYSCLLFSLGDNYSHQHWNNVFEFMNPAHSTQFIANDKWTALTYFIDLSYRVFEGLLIYQTIVAFRKYSRK